MYDAEEMTDPNGMERGFATRALRAARSAPDVAQRASSVPIYQSVTFSTDDMESLGDVLADRMPGYAYSRLDNPTAAALAHAVAELEGGEAGYAFNSGMAAIHGSAGAFVRAGDRIVAARSLYGGVRDLFATIFGRLGVETVFVDATDPDAVEAAITPSTRIVHVETIANPTLAVTDLAAVAERAHRHGALLVVDNTFASPYLCRPLDLGADLVVESCTKWIGGHSDVLAGAVAGSAELIDRVRAFEVNVGGIIAPFSAFLVLRGIETLAVRMEHHSAAALALARSLEADGLQVFYPGLASHPQAAVAQRQLRAGGGLLAVDLRTRAAAAAFLDALTIPERTASLGSVHTIAVHPPSSTHRQLDAAALAEAGIPEGLVRVSVGLEDVDDLIADFGQALAAARSTVSS